MEVPLSDVPPTAHVAVPQGDSGSRAVEHNIAISVVVPAFNTARFIAATLQSLRSQTFQDWECVIVNDGSTDDTLRVATEHATRDARFRVTSIVNRGASAARNHGFLLTDRRSEFVTFMDSDDVWLPHALEALRSRILNDPDAIGAHGLAELVDENGQVIESGAYAKRGRERLGLEGRRLIEWPLTRPTTFAVLVNGNVLFPPGLVLARRDAYERVGRFDEQFRGAEDWDMLIRLSRHGDIAFVDDVILHYRRHAANLGAAPGIEQQAWLVRCKAFHSFENTEQQQAVAKRGWRGYQRRMIRQRLAEADVQVKGRRLREATLSLIRVPVHIYRFLRSFPTPRFTSHADPWYSETQE